MENLFTQQQKQSQKQGIKTVPSSLPCKLPPISLKDKEKKQKSKKQLAYTARYKLTFPNFALNQEEELNLSRQIKETQKQKIKSNKMLYNSVIYSKGTSGSRDLLSLDQSHKKQALQPLKPMKGSHSRNTSFTKLQRSYIHNQSNSDLQAEIERAALFQEAKFQEAAQKQIKDLSCYDCWDDPKSGQI